jgi:hypothetical protein
MRLLLQCPRCRAAASDDYLGSKTHQFVGIGNDRLGIAAGKANLEPQVATFNPAEVLEALPQCDNRYSCALFVGRPRLQHADAAHALRLLRKRRERRSRCRRAQCPNELTTPHWAFLCRMRASLSRSGFHGNGCGAPEWGFPVRRPTYSERSPGPLPARASNAVWPGHGHCVFEFLALHPASVRCPKFDRTSAPMTPRFVQTMRGPKEAPAQKSGLSAIGTADCAPGYHWVFSAQTSSSRSSRARRNVKVADHGIVKAPSSSTVT